jgi:ATP/maltotriose-dependent transcriptional regulator MalT
MQRRAAGGETSRYVLAQAAFWGPTPVADGIRRCEDIRDQARGNYRLEMAALHTLAGLHAMQGRFELARDLGDASRAIAEELGVLAGSPSADLAAAESAHVPGRSGQQLRQRLCAASQPSEQGSPRPRRALVAPVKVMASVTRARAPMAIANTRAAS